MGEGEGFSAYHRQSELDAENITALSRAVKFPTVGCSDGSSESGEGICPLLIVRRNRIVIQVRIV